MSISTLRLSGLLLIASMTVGCSSVPDEEVAQSDSQVTTEYEAESHPNDPFEGFNRAMWDINYEYLDPYLVRRCLLLTLTTHQFRYVPVSLTF